MHGQAGQTVFFPMENPQDKELIPDFSQKMRVPMWMGTKQRDDPLKTNAYPHI